MDNPGLMFVSMVITALIAATTTISIIRLTPTTPERPTMTDTPIDDSEAVIDSLQSMIRSMGKEAQLCHSICQEHQRELATLRARNLELEEARLFILRFEALAKSNP